MNIIDGQVIIETKIDAAQYINSKMKDILDIQEEMSRLKVLLDQRVTELQEIQK